ncbi:MAG: hypothetical protein KAJ98_01685 [Spirochaetaceae bacterium]|nr:hypothetical protein [Spirochaetaceae bacterium]
MSGRSKAGKFLDRLTGSASTKYLINQSIKEFGQLVELKIDNRGKTVTATIILNGETLPMNLRIDEYEIIRDNSSAGMLIRDASSDKPWLNSIIKKFIIGKALKVPADRIDYLEDFLG